MDTVTKVVGAFVAACFGVAMVIGAVALVIFAVLPKQDRAPSYRVCPHCNRQFDVDLPAKPRPYETFPVRPRPGDTGSAGAKGAKEPDKK